MIAILTLLLNVCAHEQKLSPAPPETAAMIAPPEAEQKGRLDDLQIITLDKRVEVEYQAKQEGTRLIVDIKKKQPALVVTSEQKAPVTTETKSRVKATVINNLVVKPQKEGLQVIIQANGEIEKYTSFTMNDPKRLVVDMNDVVYSSAERSVRVESPFLRRIRVGEEGRRLRFVFDFPSDAGPPFQVMKERDKLIVSVGEIQPEKVATEENIAVRKDEPAAIQTTAEEQKLEKAGDQVEKGSRYTGQKISLDFKDADIKNVLRLIADVSGLNIITSDNVKGKVTIKVKDVPWDEVLNLILETNNLGKVQIGNILNIDTNVAETD
jgi:type IV pilus assembly protein PilQ